MKKDNKNVKENHLETALGSACPQAARTRSSKTAGVRPSAAAARMCQLRDRVSSLSPSVVIDKAQAIILSTSQWLRGFTCEVLSAEGELRAGQLL